MSTATVSVAVEKTPVPAPPRRLLLIVAGIAITLLALYFIISAVEAARLSGARPHPLTHTPADFGLTYQNVNFNSTVDNVPLSGWYIDSPGKKVIVMFHGFNGTRDGDVNLAVAQMLAKHNYDILMFDFRGEGESGGDRVGLGTLETRDVSGALAFLKSRGINEVGTIGFSMGAGTELNAAPDHPEMRAIVSDSAFADVNPVLDAGLPAASGLPAWFNPGMKIMARLMFGMDLMNDKPANAIARLGDRPVLLIHGTADESVPLHHLFVLYDAGMNDPNLQVWVVPGAGHTLGFRQDPDEYTRRVVAFFDKYLH